MRINDLLISLDIFLDYVPVASSASNLVDIFQKCVVVPLMKSTTITESHYFAHLERKSFPRCMILLLLPILGNIGVGVYDVVKKRAFDHMFDDKLSVLKCILEQDDRQVLDRQMKLYTYQLMVLRDKNLEKSAKNSSGIGRLMLYDDEKRDDRYVVLIKTRHNIVKCSKRLSENEAKKLVHQLKVDYKYLSHQGDISLSSRYHGGDKICFPLTLNPNF